jgi:hypothetical protein
MQILVTGCVPSSTPFQGAHLYTANIGIRLFGCNSLAVLTQSAFPQNSPFRTNKKRSFDEEIMKVAWSENFFLQKLLLW